MALRIVGSLAQPLLFLVALGYGIGPVYQQAGRGNYINFLAPGIIGMGMLLAGSNHAKNHQRRGSDEGCMQALRQGDPVERQYHQTPADHADAEHVEPAGGEIEQVRVEQ